MTDEDVTGPAPSWPRPLAPGWAAGRGGREEV